MRYTRVTSLILLACAQLILHLGGALPARAECRGATYADLFEEGLRIRSEALKTEEREYAQTYWAAAIPCFEAALSKNSAENRGRTIRMSNGISEPYLPHFALGWAYFEMGNFESAHRQLSISKDQGQIQSHPHFQRLEQMLTFLTVLDRAEEILLEAERIQRETEAQETLPLDTAFRERRAILLDDLARGWQAVAGAKRSRQQAMAEEALDVAQRAISTASLLQRRFRLVAPLEKLLVDAARAYLELRYEDVLAILGSTSFEDEAMALRAGMLKAVSHFSLYLDMQSPRTNLQSAGKLLFSGLCGVLSCPDLSMAQRITSCAYFS